MSPGSKMYTVLPIDFLGDQHLKIYQHDQDRVLFNINSVDQYFPNAWSEELTFNAESVFLMMIKFEFMIIENSCILQSWILQVF